MILQKLKSGLLDAQIVIFPHLGGNARSFINLANAVDEDLDILAFNIPGHGVTPGSIIEDLNQLVDTYYQQLLLNNNKSNTIFLGHSMGGVVAYFLIQKSIQTDDIPHPCSLVLSAVAPPSSFQNKGYSSLPDEALLNYLISYGGIPAELLNQRTFLNFFLPGFRADFKILEQSAYAQFEPLNIPIYYLWGEHDSVVDLSAAIGWRSYFTQNIQLIPIKHGSHFFINDQVDEVAKNIRMIIQSSLPHLNCEKETVCQH